MAITREFASHLEDLFSVLPGSHTRRMFGGVGVFRHGLMYALALEDGKICLKADEQTHADFTAEGCAPWVYERNGRKMDMGYWQMPEHLMDDEEARRQWAQKAFEVAMRAGAKKPPAKRKLSP
ncbi:TfoX/Sxy family protein [Salaquimonas pukyongi]|uniref:TfoX/Sxy family protein n=1 Tax=Salaquimonas pukyongi TaxID=2712698 RepID=UPI00096BCFD4|nr:TfoX/Sxy family protein [Salaquimonas pukyongi]